MLIKRVGGFLRRCNHLWNNSLFYHFRFRVCFRWGEWEERVGGRTWNILSAAVTIWQKANIFSTFGSTFIRSRRSVYVLRSSRRISINVDKFRCFRYDCRRRFESRSSTTTEITHKQNFYWSSFFEKFLFVFSCFRKTYLGAGVPLLTVTSFPVFSIV